VKKIARISPAPVDKGGPYQSAANFDSSATAPPLDAGENAIIKLSAQSGHALPSG